MSTLTGQQIKDTYDGLLKLADSTNGITPNLQAVQDGLGNNTGSRIATNYFTAPNVVNIDGNIKPDFMGCGVQIGIGNAMQATTFNKLQYSIFYDNGVHSYSAITYNLGTLTSTSDVVSFYFYSLQFVPTIGVAPKNLLMSGITLESSTTTGIKTTPLPSTLSFSGTGGGYYVYAYVVQNAGVAPTVRYGQPIVAARNQAYSESLGYCLNTAGTGINLGSRLSVATPSSGFFLNLSAQSSYTENDITNNFNNITASGMMGFGLNVIR